MARTPAVSRSRLNWSTLGPNGMTCRHRGMLATITRLADCRFQWTVTDAAGQPVNNGELSHPQGSDINRIAWGDCRRSAEAAIFAHLG